MNTIVTAAPHKAWPDRDIVEALRVVRAATPLVHGLTNSTAAMFMANVALAVGASPAMISADAEVPEFAHFADGVVIDLASVTERKAVLMLASARIRSAGSLPWLLDPAAIGRLSFRTSLARELLHLRPSVVKANASEILTLAGLEGGGRGADATVETSVAVDAARSLARLTGGAVVITGAIDFVTDGDKLVQIAGGHPLMARVTGTGCALGIVIGAFLGAKIQPFEATVAATAVFAEAGERAGATAAGPASFAVAMVDNLFQLGTDNDHS